MEEEEKFSDDPEENASIENEFLKIKLKAQFGDNFMMGGNAELPLEIENQFLKSLISFEENYKNVEYVTVFEKIGKPDFIPASNLSEKEITSALERITEILDLNEIRLDICDGPYPDKEIYTFITEELFLKEIEKEDLFFGTRVFIYEEFHPNNKADIEENTDSFFNHWFAREFNKYSDELALIFITPNAENFDSEALFAKLSLFFDAFKSFENPNYTIDEVKFDLLPNGNGFGHAQGFVKYNAILENGEFITFEGPYKLYMERIGIYWSIFYFEIPGFEW
ncbi:MAG: hypothetical protein EAZ15_04085 [Sphingobacteriales bacterium]|nr:MAG: hypothetical protein EAZ15_04085 [Sphingobacteriales bacterium]